MGSTGQAITSSSGSGVIVANLLDVVLSVAENAEGLKIGGLTAGRTALNAYLKKRNKDAQQILFDELSRGDVFPEQIAAEDDGIAVIHGYLRAAWEGRARVNLRLLAKAITGQLQQRRLVADEYYLHAETLAGLSRDEIVLLATMIRCFGVVERSAYYKWKDTEAELGKHGWTEARIQATGGRALRSGYAYPQYYGHGEMVVHVENHYLPSPLLLELEVTVDFQDALLRE